MPEVQCSIPGCDYKTPDVDASIVVELLKTHSAIHPPAAAAATAKVERVRRPTVTAAGTSEDWAYFQSRWNDYVAATKIEGTDKVIQLIECCDEPLRKDLTRSAGGSLKDKSHDEVMAAIRKLAVREENTMVARVTLHNMRQDRDETVRSFGARLQGQTNICKFIVKCANCNNNVNYTDAIMRDVLSRGICDAEIQMDLLGDQNQNMSLEDVYQFVEVKEAGKRSASRLLDSHAVEATSSYRKSRQQTNKADHELCSYCGKTGHGVRSPAHIRRMKCPAYGHKCELCQRDHHLEAVCRSKDKPPRRQSRSQPKKNQLQEDAVFDSFCTLFDSASVGSDFTPDMREMYYTTPTVNYEYNVTQVQNDQNLVSNVCVLNKTVPLDHHVYEGTWVKRNSKPQPFINVNIQVISEDYDQLGLQGVNVPSLSASVPALADTGCQSCLTGLRVIHRLGLRQEDLIPVSMRMHNANNECIPILGAVLLQITCTDHAGQTTATRQMTYVTDTSEKLFLSREACVALRIIPPDFPQKFVPMKQSANDIHHTSTAPCGCPKRQMPPPLPDSPPLPATGKNRAKLQQFLLDYYSSSTFNTCEHQQLPLMDSPPLKLMVDPKAKPVAHHTPVPVPLHWREAVKEGLDQDVRLGVIEPVPIGEPVTWCHRMVVCAKKNGKPRRTVDFQALNQHATRETHHTASPFLQARSVPPMKKKTIFDAWNGYHSVPICEEDRHLTTFITPWGRYRYKTAPQGYISSGDGYTRRYDEIVADVPNKTKCVDDVLLWADNIEESFQQAANWLDICGRNGIILNPEKFQFGADTVEFAGFEISETHVRPSQKYMRAILDFPTPNNLTDVRSWFGLVNQVSYTFSMADRMQPFRDLLKPNVHFRWTDELQLIFEDSKRVIACEIEKGVAIFDPSRPTCLTTDWSKTGIGFWLLQKHCNCAPIKPFCCPTGWKITLVGSRFTHSAESRYAPIEGEALAVVDALDKARYFVLGCSDLIIAVDHKPLLKIFTDRSLEDISNTRLRNLKEKTLRYRFRMVHVPGVKHLATDCLSRHPTNEAVQLLLPDDVASLTSPCDNETEECVLSTAVAALNALSVKSVTWDRVRLATASDPDMLQLSDLIEEGMPSTRSEMPESLRDYFHLREDLSTVDGIILYKDRVVIPVSLRDEVLAALHSAHQGVTAMSSRAEASVYWPGISQAIHTLRLDCSHCNRIAPSNPTAPPIPPMTPEYPFQCVCADYFTYKGHNYLVVVDRYSNWPIVERAANGASGLISCLRQIFATFGIPDELASDGGPEFVATSTRNFLKDWGVHHRLSSVAFPHSNCRAEIGVKSVKRLLMDNTTDSGDLNTDKFQRAILQLRNTPDRNTKMSPAMHIFGHPIKDFIPIPPGNYKPHSTWRSTALAREEALRNRHMQCAERLSEHTKRLPPLAVGDFVCIQNQTGPHPLKWDKTGVVVEVRQYDQYCVRVDGSGRITLRNRKFLRQYTPVQHPAARLTIDGDLGLYKPSSNPAASNGHSTTPGQSHSLTPPFREIQQTTPAPKSSDTLVTPKGSNTMTRSPNDNVQIGRRLTFDSQESHPDVQSPPTHENHPSTDPCPIMAPELSSPLPHPSPQRPARQKRAPLWHKDYVVQINSGLAPS